MLFSQLHVLNMNNSYFQELITLEPLLISENNCTMTISKDREKQQYKISMLIICGIWVVYEYMVTYQLRINYLQVSVPLQHRNHLNALYDSKLAGTGNNWSRSLALSTSLFRFGRLRIRVVTIVCSTIQCTLRLGRLDRHDIYEPEPLQLMKQQAKQNGMIVKVMELCHYISFHATPLR